MREQLDGQVAVVIGGSGGIGAATGLRSEGIDAPDKSLDPEAIAEAYWQLHVQHRSTWTQELDLRPWVEVF